jgi:hypothetical protein
VAPGLLLLKKRKKSRQHMKGVHFWDPNVKKRGRRGVPEDGTGDGTPGGSGAKRRTRQ